MGLRLSAAPATEPVTAAQLKEHLHYTASDQDDRIAALISAARQAVESETDRALFTQTWVLSLDAFPSVIVAPRPPLQSVTSIQYYDTSGTQQTLDSEQYQVDTACEPGRIAPARNCEWPSTDPETLGAVTVTYVAGWDDADDIPDELKHAIKLIAGHWFENIQGVADVSLKQVPFAIRTLLNHWWMPS